MHYIPIAISKRIVSAATFLLWFGLPALAEETLEAISFDGETITIVETGDGEQSIRIGKRELGRNFFAGFDRQAEVQGIPVALFYLGDGGNACGPSTLIVWRNEAGSIEHLNHGEDCSAPAPAISEGALWFVPYLLPGESAPVRSWTPSAGIQIDGIMHYVPQPGSGWDELVDPAPSHPLDMMRNEAVYNAVSGLLESADSLAWFSRGLSVASQPEMSDGFLRASGCVPHMCSEADSLIVADTRGQAVYIAQKRDGKYRTWPPEADWPEAALQALNGYRQQ